MVLLVLCFALALAFGSVLLFFFFLMLFFRAPPAPCVWSSISVIITHNVVFSFMLIHSGVRAGRGAEGPERLLLRPQVHRQLLP